MFIKASYSRINIICILGMVMCIVMLTGCSWQSDGLAPTIVVPQSQEKPLQLLNNSAKLLYDYTQKGNYEEARVELARFSDLLIAVSYKGITTLEGVNALTESVMNARRTYSHIHLSAKDAVTSATQLRLITDALTHPNRPMWLEYEDVLRQDAKKLVTMVNSNNDVGSLAALKMLYEHYSIIHPAAIVTREAYVVERIDSLFKFLTVELAEGNVDYSTVKQGMNELPGILNELFSNNDSQASGNLVVQTSNVLWTSVIASIIITALVYVAWRRYRGLGA